MTHTRVRSLFRAMTVLAVVAMASPTWAAPVAATNYDTVDEGAAVNAFLTTDFLSSSNSGPVVDIGDLTGRVYQNGSIYTYELTVTAETNNISEFNTQFAVGGFTGVAGYSSTDAASVGTEFTINVNDDNTIDFTAVNENAFDSGESVTFFFQSTLPPGELRGYALINGRVGETLNYAPGREGPGQVIPVPAALPAGLMLLGLSGLLRRRSA